MTDAARWKATLHVRGLSPHVTLTTLQEAFLPFGEIADISLPKNDQPPNKSDQQNGDRHQQLLLQDSTQQPTQSTHRGFAYVEYEDADDAKEALDNMDQAELFGRVIRVSAAKAPKSVSGQGLGARTAVWEQEGWLAEHAVSEEDRLATEQAQAKFDEDPMQGLEGLDVAGPKPE